MEKIKLIVLISAILSVVLSFEQDFNKIPTGEDYITGEDGIKRIYVNVWGHVKSPGPYLVYESIDIITLLSVSGGPLDGANLSKVKIINQLDNKIKYIDLNKIIESEASASIQFNPYDTVVIKPTLGYYIRNNSGVLNTFLQIINIALNFSND
ncbi:MAG: hypothetical protein CBD97_01160 [Pelagibacteraceae bacterium TMED237]|nr:hypothetical protein [Candidatus Neomarinimicrobiota bacterium]OUW96604.1 MAG: hypothetical protein CBD97_01160 [Pelagibacteraceae bacterium TMED237]